MSRAIPARSLVHCSVEGKSHSDNIKLHKESGSGLIDPHLGLGLDIQAPPDAGTGAANDHHIIFVQLLRSEPNGKDHHFSTPTSPTLSCDTVVQYSCSSIPVR